MFNFQDTRVKLMPNQKGFVVILVITGLVIVSVSILLYVRTHQSSQNGFSQFFFDQSTTPNMKLVSGERVENRGCSGSGTIMFGTSPMDPKDIGAVLPLGLMTGSHVTPADHMYFQPKDFPGGVRDEYDVRAIADGVITQIEERTIWVEDKNNGAPKPAEYQLRFWHTCDFSSYFDLLTSLSPKIKAEFDAHKNGNNASVQIPVKEGEVVGKIGGQTLDFSVFDYTKILPGFIVPEHYLSEPWKVHVVNAFDYFKEPVKSELLALDARKTEPRNGKIDYDIDGKLVGNWVKERNNGFEVGSGPNSYPWRAELTFAYDYINPTQIVISIGDFGGQAVQFGVLGNSPDPASIDQSSGIVKYQLIIPPNTTPGVAWGGSNSQGSQNPQVAGVVLAQLIAPRKLKFEAFPEKVALHTNNFDNNAIIYER